MPLFSPLWLRRPQGHKTPRRPTRRRPVRRLLLENLEDRTVPSTTLFVVPSTVSTDSTHFHDLASADAAASPGDVIQVELNSNPGAATIDKTLTVQGDPADSPSSLPQTANTTTSLLALAASGIVLNNLNLGVVSINLGQTGETISNSLVSTIAETVGFGTNGSNRIFNDTITDIAVLGNDPSEGGSASGDQVVNNNFIHTGAANPLLLVRDDQGALIQGNSFTSFSIVTAVHVEDCTSASILNNNITLTGTRAASTGIEVFNQFLPSSVTISNNRISTNDVGTGIFLERNSSNTFSASVANNNLVLNLVGSAVAGGPDSTDFGTIDAGGGSLGSVGGNDFHGFTGSGGHFAITTSINAGVSTNTVNSLNNSFSVTPTSAVNATAGKIDVSTSLDANHAFVDTLYDDFLGRSGSPAPGSELDFWSGHLASLGQSVVASDISRSTEGYTRLVDNLYLKILGRTADTSGEAFWLGAFQAGATLEQVIAGFLGSAEYAARANTLAFAPTNSDVNYVQSLYTLLLGRTASASEVDFWFGQLAAFGRTSVARGFLASTEFRSDVVQALYSPNTPLPSTSFVGMVPELLNRSTLPAPAEVSFWVNSGLDLLRIEVAIAASAEFFTNG